MKTLIAALALTAAVASPALAKDRVNNHVRSVSPYEAYAAAPYLRQDNRRRVTINDVYDIRGHYIGSDPDPTVRDQLARDPTGGD